MIVSIQFIKSEWITMFICVWLGKAVSKSLKAEISLYMLYHRFILLLYPERNHFYFKRWVVLPQNQRSVQHNWVVGSISDEQWMEHPTVKNRYPQVSIKIHYNGNCLALRLASHVGKSKRNENLLCTTGGGQLISTISWPPNLILCFLPFQSNLCLEDICIASLLQSH